MFTYMAYNTNFLYVMLGPETWIIAAVCIFALRRRSIPVRLSIAFIASLALSILTILWPSGDWFHAYALPATMREVAATMVWCGLFLLVQRAFSRSK